jgi:cell wall-associated NlpC family hydrolase
VLDGTQNTELLASSINLADLIGKPFADGGRGPDAFDCWGLAQEVYRRFGVCLPDYRIPAFNKAGIFNCYQAVKSNYIEVSGNLPVPCLVFLRFNSPVGNHVGIYLGDGKFIHARQKTGICIERLDHLAYKRCILGYYLPRRNQNENIN